MKFYLFSILLLSSYPSFSQDLRNTKWIKILSINVESGKIQDSKKDNIIGFGYLFNNDSVITLFNNLYFSSYGFSVKNKTLSIGRFLNYHIDTMNNVILKLTEIPRATSQRKVINSYGFINEKFLFQYLREKNLISITGDTLIEPNKYFSPAYPFSGLSEIIIDPFRSIDSIELAGYFTINSNRIISDIQFQSSKKIKEKQRKAFEIALRKTENSWILPYTESPYSFRVHFYCSFKKSNFSLRGVSDSGHFSMVKINTDD